MFTQAKRWLSGVLSACLLANCAAPPGATPPAVQCPQPRFTGTAPAEFLGLRNPLAATDAAVLAAGRKLYQASEAQAGCSACHGDAGNGRGTLSSQFYPPPRDFTCAQTVKGIPDGQLFWIIRKGSPDTAMPSHPGLADTQIWQLVAYLRNLARD